MWLRAGIPWHQHLLPPILDVGTTPLGIAARATIDVAMVRFLLSRGADPNLEHSDCTSLSPPPFPIYLTSFLQTKLTLIIQSFIQTMAS